MLFKKLISRPFVVVADPDVGCQTKRSSETRRNVHKRPSRDFVSSTSRSIQQIIFSSQFHIILYEKLNLRMQRFRSIDSVNIKFRTGVLESLQSRAKRGQIQGQILLEEAFNAHSKAFQANKALIDLQRLQSFREQVESSVGSLQIALGFGAASVLLEAFKTLKTNSIPTQTLNFLEAFKASNFNSFQESVQHLTLPSLRISQVSKLSKLQQKLSNLP